MKKKVLVLAVGAALTAPVVFAQDKPAIEIYGRFYPQLNNIHGSGPTAATETVATLAATPVGASRVVNRTEMQPNNSRFGFKGQRDIGGGIKMFWQLEQEIAMDEGDSTWATRNTFLGMTTSMGTIKLGQMDTIFKEYGDTLGILGVSSGNFVSTSNVLRKIGIGPSSDASFHLRAPNSVQYETPGFNGVTFGVQHATGTRTTDQNTARPEHNPRLLSMGVKYEKGPLYLALAHEIHYDYFGGSNNVAGSRSNTGFSGNTPRETPGQAVADDVDSTDKATQFTVEYRLGIHRVAFDYNMKEYKETAGIANGAARFKSYENNAYMLSMENRWNSTWRTAFHYIRASAGKCEIVQGDCNTDGLEGTQISAGVAYFLDRRTYLFGLVSQLTNGKSARFENLESDRANPGEDIRQVAFGIRHDF